MSSLLTRSGLTRGRWTVGVFLAVALGATLACSAISAAEASTSPSARTSHGGAIESAGSSNLINHGGPVETAPKVYVVYWGWTSDPNGEQPYLNSLLSDVGGSSWLSTVHQYSGAGYTGDLLNGTWSDSASVPTHPTDAQVQAEAKKAAGHFGAGTSDNVQIVVATPTGHSESGFGTQWCAYHSDISADPNVTYTYLPYMTDAGAACGENAVNSGSAGILDGVSLVEGDDLAEAITDPLLSGWYDTSGREIGDKCTGGGDVVLLGHTFALQPLWSNAIGGCVL